MHIHEHEIELLAAQHVEGFAAGLGDGGGVAVFAQQPHRQLLVHRVVLRDEDAEARSGSDE